MTLFAGRGLHGGLSFFETTEFTELELAHLRALDVFFVASEWGRQVAIANGLAPTAVVTTPMGVDRSVFPEADPPTGERTVFLHIGAWQRRKGQDAILDAFAKAFRPGDAVELRMLCDNPWAHIGDDRWRDECLRSPMAEHITVVPRVAGQREVAAHMRDADCGVFPARGEAWNLELLEMMSTGRPVIATDYGGHTEFATPDNALLIEVDELEPVDDPVWMWVFTGRKVGDWARLGERQVDQLVEHLRTVHTRKQAGEPLRNDAGIATAERFSWAITARCIVDGFSTVSG
jgi:glycosyltransferase involved in cell wall biosynthesis